MGAGSSGESVPGWGAQPRRDDGTQLPGSQPPCRAGPGLTGQRAHLTGLASAPRNLPAEPRSAPPASPPRAPTAWRGLLTGARAPASRRRIAGGGAGPPRPRGESSRRPRAGAARTPARRSLSGPPARPTRRREARPEQSASPAPGGAEPGDPLPQAHARPPRAGPPPPPPAPPVGRPPNAPGAEAQVRAQWVTSKPAPALPAGASRPAPGRREAAAGGALGPGAAAEARAQSSLSCAHPAAARTRPRARRGRRTGLRARSPRLVPPLQPRAPRLRAGDWVPAGRRPPRGAGCSRCSVKCVTSSRFLTGPPRLPFKGRGGRGCRRA